ncbi:unspecified product [Leishmania tarentolae]|uniref:Unspecified product n=1 Tax=Leishmania tarentolae TaxID=5689 RepID=A0A640K8Z0_LEITA|nr:unspecified product [Leishmania tarentolae]
MSRFSEHLVDLVWRYGHDTTQGLKAVSRSLVEDDEDVLVFLILMGIPTLLVLWAISRCINRAHNRVRYAADYRAVDRNDYVTSSSSLSDSSCSGEDDVAAHGVHQGNRRSWYQPTMDQVAQAARQLTEQETARRRRNRRVAARYGHGGDSSTVAAPDGETEGRD